MYIYITYIETSLDFYMWIAIEILSTCLYIETYKKHIEKLIQKHVYILKFWKNMAAIQFSL